MKQRERETQEKMDLANNRNTHQKKENRYRTSSTFPTQGERKK